MGVSCCKKKTYSDTNIMVTNQLPEFYYLKTKGEIYLVKDPHDM